jgi:hypothetical protein
MSYWDKLSPDLQHHIYGLRLKKSYYDKIKCNPDKDINRLIKEDLIDCIIERWFFIDPKYIHLMGRTRFKYVINGFTFLILLHRLFEFSTWSIVIKDKNINKDNILKIINICLKHETEWIEPKINKKSITIDDFDSILDLLPETEHSYNKLSKPTVYNILTIFDKNTLKKLYMSLNGAFLEKENIYDD